MTIKTRFDFRGNFKTIYPLLSIIGGVTLLDIDYVKHIQCLIINNFKVIKARDPWMYDPLSLFMKTLKKYKKCPSFKHELHPYIECYSSQIEKEVEQTSEWNLTPFRRDWFEILGIKKH